VKSDAEIKRDIEDELRRRPAGHDSIAVAVTNGIALLTGFAVTRADALAVESAAKLRDRSRRSCQRHRDRRRHGRDAKEQTARHLREDTDTGRQRPVTFDAQVYVESRAPGCSGREHPGLPRRLRLAAAHAQLSAAQLRLLRLCRARYRGRIAAAAPRSRREAGLVLLLRDPDRIRVVHFSVLGLRRPCRCRGTAVPRSATAGRP
jgi:hypothetical protein